MKSSNCDECYQFGIVKTTLSDLIKGLGLAFTLIVGILSWECLQLYNLNAKISTIVALEHTIKTTEDRNKEGPFCYVERR